MITIEITSALHRTCRNARRKSWQALLELERRTELQSQTLWDSHMVVRTVHLHRPNLIYRVSRRAWDFKDTRSVSPLIDLVPAHKTL